MPSSLFKQEFYLKADNEQESAQSGLLTFVNVSRSGIQVIKRAKSFKAVEFVGYRFAFALDNKTWSNSVTQVLDSEEHKAFVSDSNISFSISDSHVTLVPASLYSENEKVQNFEFLFGESQGISIQTQTLSNSDAVGIFGVPEEITEVISDPICSSYLDWLDALPTDTTKARANLVLNEKQFALIIQKEGKLVFSNWFDYSKSEDVLYYLMASLETLKILHSEVEVILNGRVEKGGDIHGSIGKFISKLSFGKRPKNLTHSYSFKELPEHQFPFIFSSACA